MGFLFDRSPFRVNFISKRNCLMIRIKGLILFLLLTLSTGITHAQDVSNYLKKDTVTGKVYNDIDLFVIENGYKHKTMQVPPSQVFLFPGLRGPSHTTLYPERIKTSWTKYQEGGTNRLCVYLRDTNSFWLGLVHGLISHSIPFRVTTNIDEAILHKVILAYPGLTSQKMDLGSFKKLRDFVKNGGTLIGFNLFSPSLWELFGIGGAEVNSKRDRIHIHSEISPLVDFAKDPLERTIRIGNFKVSPDALESYGYSGLEYRPLATFSDGTGAVTQKIYNKGVTYAFGVDLGFFTLICHTNLDAQFRNTYVNGFEPTLDVLYRIIKNIYLKHCSIPVFPGLVPQNKYVAISVTHDVDTHTSIPNQLVYAEIEQRNNTRATYFIQAKYIKDGQDEALLRTDYLPYYYAIKNMGMEIGSHSVSHTPFFKHIPIGTGDETYPDYQPYFVTGFSCFNETVLGELRVSKFLLDEVLHNNTVSFRTGFLGRSETMYPALEATGYKYASCVTANDVMTHMPFQLSYDVAYDSQLEVFEFPITIEDEGEPPMNQRISAAIFLTDKIAPYGGLINILIHPNEIKIKTEFLEGYLEHFRDIAWLGPMGEYGEWWVAKSKMQIDAEVVGEEVQVTLDCPQEIKDFPLLVPSNLFLLGTNPGWIEYQPIDGGYLFTRLKGTIRLRFERTSL